MENGLSANEVLLSREKNGSNALLSNEGNTFLQVIKDVVKEPMFILLLAACFVYFFVGSIQEGLIMLVSIFIVAGISIFQDYRSRNAVKALNKLSASKVKVRRGAIVSQIPAEELVVGDLMILEEGEFVAADGVILAANDFSLNESVLTGESFTVRKDANGINQVYKGTLVTGGSAEIKVSAVGINTVFGKIGVSLQEIKISKTPLQQQIHSFVKYMVWIGALAFIVVVAFNYYQSRDFIASFLQGLTLAMSILPEEIPVAFSTFQALGAFRLLGNNIIVKQPQYVETLGSATVICADKTGTLTQNKMKIEYLYDAVAEKSIEVGNTIILPGHLIEYAMWSSEINPFDPMEIAIHELYKKSSTADKRATFKQIHEYPLSGNPPMMTHIFSNDNEIIIAVKGAPEAIIARSNLSSEAIRQIEKQSIEYAKKGYRVLGVGKGNWKEKSWPVSQEEFTFEFLGLLAFQDPPKDKIIETIRSFKNAGIRVVMITGDYAETALAISKQIQLCDNELVLTGKEILQISPAELSEKVKTVNVFARMFPQAKLKVIEALKDNGEIVAMTGDGVNDGPALKAAHIGISMGSRGTEVAKNAASLILTDDDLSHMTEAVSLGRKIYDNLKKAVQYIVSIHIPIILIVVAPLLLHWKYPNIFSPIHVIFLELIMGPTCSIIYENEPIEPGTMLRPPRKLSATFLSFNQLTLSIVQGLVISLFCLSTGYIFMENGASENTTRTVIFIGLLFSNFFLTLSNRSFNYSVFKTLAYKNILVPIMILITLFFIFTILYIPFARNLFNLENLSFYQMLTTVSFALVGVSWIEVWKYFHRKKAYLNKNAPV